MRMYGTEGLQKHIREVSIIYSHGINIIVHWLNCRLKANIHATVNTPMCSLRCEPFSRKLACCVFRKQF